jgi:hypothetical protein
LRQEPGLAAGPLDKWGWLHLFARPALHISRIQYPHSIAEDPF